VLKSTQEHKIAAVNDPMDRLGRRPELTKRGMGISNRTRCGTVRGFYQSWTEKSTKILACSWHGKWSVLTLWIGQIPSRSKTYKFKHIKHFRRSNL